MFSGKKRAEGLDISTLSPFVYGIAFAKYRSAFSDLCIRESERNGRIISAQIDGRYVGYLCETSDFDRIKISYAFTVPEYRGQGIFTALLRYSVENADCIVRVNIPSQHEFHDIVVKTCNKEGCIQGESVSVFTCRRENYPAWSDFMEKKGKSMCSYLEHKGYRTVRLKDAGDELIRQLLESPHTAYGNSLDPAGVVGYPINPQALEMSCLTEKDGTLAAYTLVMQRASDKAVFEHISDSEKERGSGVILLPFAASMNAYYESSCESVSYAMYGSNSHANAFRMKLLGKLNSSVAVSENYYFNMHLTFMNNESSESE